MHPQTEPEFYRCAQELIPGLVASEQVGETWVISCDPSGGEHYIWAIFMHTWLLEQPYKGANSISVLSKQQDSFGLAVHIVATCFNKTTVVFLIYRQYIYLLLRASNASQFSFSHYFVTQHNFVYFLTLLLLYVPPLTNIVKCSRNR